MAVITISKQYGSMAEEITQRVCKTLGYRYFEKGHILQLAIESGISDNDIFDITVDDVERKKLFHIITPEFHQIPVAGYNAAGTASFDGSTVSTYLNFTEKLDDEQALTMLQSLMRKAVHRGNIVISGRGGQALFQNYPDVYHCRITAPLEMRVENVMERENMGRSEAQKIIKKHDSAAEAYLKRIYRIDWEDPDLYHLLINTGKTDTDKATKIITDLVD